MGHRCTPLPSVVGLVSLWPPDSISFVLLASIYRHFSSTCVMCVQWDRPTGDTTSSPPTPPQVSVVAFLSSLKSLNGDGVLDSSPGVVVFSFTSLDSSSTDSLGSLSGFNSTGVSETSFSTFLTTACSLCFSAVNSGSLCSFVDFLGDSLSSTASKHIGSVPVYS